MKTIRDSFCHILLTLTLMTPLFALGDNEEIVKTITRISLAAQTSELKSSKLEAIKEIASFVENRNPLMINSRVLQAALGAIGNISVYRQLDAEVQLAALSILENYALSWHGNSVGVSAMSIEQIGWATRSKRVIRKIDAIVKKMQASRIPGRADIALFVQRSYAAKLAHSSELIDD